jgi:hypothetical protein
MGNVSGRQLARAAVGVVAVLAQIAQIALAFYYVGLPLLVVPGSAIYALWLLWAVQLVAVIWLAIRHTWIAPLVPVASFIAVKLIYAYGNANLGWGA